MRNTRQRTVILEELRRTDRHPTADELHRRVRRRLPRVSLATVYRNLEQLSDLGIVQKLELGGTQRRFDADLTDHCHVRCVRCGCVDDVDCEPHAHIEAGRAATRGYEILGHRLELFGLCPECRKHTTGKKP